MIETIYEYLFTGFMTASVVWFIDCVVFTCDDCWDMIIFGLFAMFLKYWFKLWKESEE